MSSDAAIFCSGKLDLLHQRFVFLVGLDVERLVAVLADLQLLVLDVGLVLSARGLVRLGSGQHGLDLCLAAGKLGFDLGDVLRQGGDFRPQRGDLRINLLQLDEILQVGSHHTLGNLTGF